MLNWAVDPALLLDRVPAGTVLDENDGHHWVSVVGFLFLDTRVLGLPIPGHRDFEELNLRFYVRRDEPDPQRGLDHRRGVVFVKELVPRQAIALVARWVYNEAYEARPMRHRIERAEAADIEASLRPGDGVSYGFRMRGSRPEWGEVSARVHGPAEPLVEGAHPCFIAEHYWGYARQRDGGTVEYEVRHPSWRVHPASTPVLKGDLERLYGVPLARVLEKPPQTAFVAEGSEVAVLKGRRLR